MSARPPHLPRRLHPRRRTLLRATSPVGANARVLNVSVDGMFVETTDPDALDRVTIAVPGASSPVEVDVLRAWRRGSGTAVQFRAPDPAARRALTSHVHYEREAERVRAMEGRLGKGAHNLRPMSEDVALPQLLRTLQAAEGRVQLWLSDAEAPLDLRVSSVDRASARLRLLSPAGHRLPDAYQEAVLVVPQDDTFWLADTFVDQLGPGGLSLVLPERMFLPERRSGDRDPASGWSLRLADGLVLDLLDLDADGLRVRLPAGLPVDERLEGATLVRGGREEALEPLALAWTKPGLRGRTAGFRRVHERRSFPAAKVERFPSSTGRFQVLREGVGATWDSVLRRVGFNKPPEPKVWVVEHDDGRPIVTLEDTSFTGDPGDTVHVVLVPPAYGRRKEHPAALAATIVSTFSAARKPVIVLRWDGVDHVGESFVSPDSQGPDHQMLRYTQGQAKADLAQVIRRVRERFAGKTIRTAAVSMSLAAVAVRRYLAEGGEGIDYWIAPMGAADARDTIRNGAGGIDIVGARMQGATLGVQLIQGHLVDADHHVDDLVDGGFADLADARRDFAKIRQPVCWIVGTHDYWVNRRRVEEALSVPAPGPRELVELPCGHQLRHGTDAVETFKVVAERVLSTLSGAQHAGVVPAGWELRAKVTAERNRLKTAPFDSLEYWRNYLLGREGNVLGFDLLTLTDEYTGLLDDEVRALAPEPGWRIVDLGCGTGNLLAELVRSAHGPELHLVGADFVPEALERARSKLAELGVAGEGTPASLRFHPVDLRLEHTPNLPFGEASIDAVVLGLVVPYLSEPERLLAEVRRVLRPGGRVVVSSLLPDADMSGPIQRLREKIERGDDALLEGWRAPDLLAAMRAYINDAAALLDGEVQGRFHFHLRGELEQLLRKAGFVVDTVRPSFGDPPLGVVVAGHRPDA